MKKRVIFPIALTCFSLASTACSFNTTQPANEEESSTTTHWSYEGETGPEHWAELDPANTACINGVEQSPINIEKSKLIEKAELENLEINYIPSSFSLVNNGHTIQANPQASDNSIVIDGKTYTLAQLHFHTPSEHQLNGKEFDMELHLVHKNEDDELAVLGVLIKEGNVNTTLEKMWNSIPEEKTEEEVKLAEPVDLMNILPENQHTYQYEGSLTTPPCSEGVHWIVLEHPIEMSKKQIAAFRQIFPDNHRPVQPVKEREVIKN